MSPRGPRFCPKLSRKPGESGSSSLPSPQTCCPIFLAGTRSRLWAPPRRLILPLPGLWEQRKSARQSRRLPERSRYCG